jgi:hypothetical protein
VSERFFDRMWEYAYNFSCNKDLRSTENSLLYVYGTDNSRQTIGYHRSFRESWLRVVDGFFDRMCELCVYFGCNRDLRSTANSGIAYTRHG